MPLEPPKRRITASEIRELCDTHRFFERLASGEFSSHIRRDLHAPETSGEPYCTRSQIVAYSNSSGKRVAIFHQYKRQSGELGASGKPDPKQLTVDGINYYT